MSNATTPNTAALRNQAWDAMQEQRYAEAAELYEAAIAAYPDGVGELREADLAGLRRRAQEARSAVVTAAELDREAAAPLRSGSLEWRRNEAGMWAWFDGERQVTGARGEIGSDAFAAYLDTYGHGFEQAPDALPGETVAAYVLRGHGLCPERRSDGSLHSEPVVVAERPAPAPAVYDRTEEPAEEPEGEPADGEAEALAGALSDISMAAAVRAHSGTSFVPERRGEQVKAEYAATLRADYRNLALHAGTPEKLEALAASFAEYRQGYRSRVIAWLNSRAGVVSTMIAGPSGFNVRRAEKRNASADKRAEEMIAYRERVLDAIRKELRPELRPIMSGDADATARLADKIANLEDLQAHMKAANAAIRKAKKAGPVAQVAALVAIGFSEGQAGELIKPDFCGRIGFADYQLQNNGAEIRRAKARLEAVGATQAREATEAEGEHARLEDCPAENRVRLWFPGKPAAEVRDALKRSGFRWAPSLGCWQAYRNHRSMEASRALAGLPAAS